MIQIRIWVKYLANHLIDPDTRRHLSSLINTSTPPSVRAKLPFLGRRVRLWGRRNLSIFLFFYFCMGCQLTPMPPCRTATSRGNPAVAAQIKATKQVENKSSINPLVVEEKRNKKQADFHAILGKC